MEVPLARIHANKLQPREDIGDVGSLAESIRQDGLLDPVKLAPCTCGDVAGPHFRVLDGHRRLRAMLLVQRSLSGPQYRLYEGLTAQQEVALVVDTNIQRKQYKPKEMYEALELKRRYGMMKGTAAAGMGYYNLRTFMSSMGRLHPDLRARVVWKRGGAAGQVTVRQARELAQVGQTYQKALVEADLTPGQLRAAIGLIKEKAGVITPEDAITKAKALEVAMRAEDKAAAAFLLGYLAIFKRTVHIQDLVAFGFSRSTAQRTIWALERGGMLTEGGSADPRVLDKLREMALVTQRDAAEFLRRFFSHDGAPRS
ncbi:MAG: ParB N-terminal domain-containing protein [Nitrososphaerota archaeon]|nr:ParB N-terminal domain-containing protein [Nitrososphaerota archaeon]